MTIAVDFDGTLCEYAFPGTGEQKQIHKNVEDIPEGNYLTEAIEWCKAKGLEFDYVNQNPECDFGHPEKVRKIVADCYIDDRAINLKNFAAMILQKSRWR